MVGKEVGRVSPGTMLVFIIKIQLLYYRNPTLEFVAAPALAPAEVALDAKLIEQYELELKQVIHLRPAVEFMWLT